MGFIKRHAFLIVCILASGGGVALGVIFMGKMSDVQTKMQAASGLHGGLNSVRGAAANQWHIDEQNKRIKSIEEDHDRILTRLKEVYHFTPLVSGFFPEPPAGVAYEKRLTFREEYMKAMGALLARLGDPNEYGPREVERVRVLIDNERVTLEEAGEVERLARMDSEQFTLTPAGVTNALGAEADPIARASLYCAQKVSCYYTPLEKARTPIPASSLDYYRPMTGAGTEPPTVGECWLAQVGYWIQTDIVDAIVAVNDKAKADLPDDKHWVAHMPVKEVISIRVRPDYIIELGGHVYGDTPGGFKEAIPPGTGESTFTKSICGQTYDVVQFTVKLIIEEEAIPAFLEALCADRFCTPLRIAYKDVETNYRMREKIYGDAPVLNVVMDFEVLMLSEIFKPLMPDEICDTYTFMCPSREPVE